MEHTTFIGGGNMARALLGGLIQSGADARSIHVVEPDDTRRQALADDFGLTVHADSAPALEGAETVVLAVKPQIMRDVVTALAPELAQPGPLVISIAAGLRSDQIERWFGTPTAIVRVMPNTPALIGAGASGLFANAQVNDSQRQHAERILGASGIFEWITDEPLMDAVTAISGSAPAYFFAFVEALEEAGVALGLDRPTARRLASQTCLGAGRMSTEDPATPSELRKRVTSPHGTTEAALASLADAHLEQIVAAAATAARDRGQELARAYDD